MKQQDIAALIGIVVFTGALTYFVTTTYITPKNESLKAEIVSEIKSEFPLPSNTQFNDQSINPTRRIEIAPNNNDQPFSQSQ
jgi:hypothetical protein